MGDHSTITYLYILVYELTASPDILNVFLLTLLFIKIDFEKLAEVKKFLHFLQKYYDFLPDINT